jgi:hypothetical protein
MVQGLPILAKYQHHWHLYISKCSAYNSFKVMFSYFIYIVLKLKNKYSFFFLLFIFNPLCRRTIRQYVEQVLRLCTVLVFPPPFDFVHIYIVKSYPHTLSIKILLYTVKILQFVRLLLKVNYMNRIV